MLNQPLVGFHDFHPLEEDFAAAVVRGLSRGMKTLPCKFFYDRRGSELFEAICELDAYYPTRTEIGLLKEHGAEIAELAGPGSHLVEFGSGASIKVRILLDAMEPASYVPIDISRDHLLQTATDLARDVPDLPVVAVCADYTRDFDFPDLGDGPRVGFFPGSTIGNFTPDEAVDFLRRAHGWLEGGGLVIGVDLMKDPAVLQAAYDDEAGITEAFNKNLLVRCNTELGAAFDVDAFEHRAVVDVDEGRVEMHLVSTRNQEARLNGHTFAFEEGETIHTENSYKYTLDGFRHLAEESGFDPQYAWTDSRGLFSIHYLVAA